MPDESSAEQGSSALVPAEASAALKRSHQVKVTLNAAELAFLDGLVGQMGSDRSSVFRHLLRLAGGSALQEPSPAASDGQVAGEPPQPPITRIELKGLNPAELPKASVKIYEPCSFDELPEALKDLGDGAILILNLTMMEPDQAQRAVDFTAGGTFSLHGHQERIGESIFLFAPKTVTVEMASDSEGDLNKLAGSAGMLLKEGKPAKEEQAASKPTADSDSDSEEKAFPASQLPAASPEPEADAETGPEQSPEPNEETGWQSQSEDEPTA